MCWLTWKGQYLHSHTPGKRAGASAPTNDHQEFTLLRVPESALVKRIQEAYRQVALQQHPDCGGAHLLMVALNRASALALASAKANTAA